MTPTPLLRQVAFILGFTLLSPSVQALELSEITEIVVNDFDPSTGTVDYSLVNRWDAPICASAVEITTLSSDGTPDTLTIFTDSYSAATCIAKAEHRVQVASIRTANATRTMLLGVEVIALVSDTSKGIGNREALNRIRLDRMAERIISKRVRERVYRELSRGRKLSEIGKGLRADKPILLKLLPEEVPTLIRESRVESILSLLEREIEKTEQNEQFGPDAARRILGLLDSLDRPEAAEKIATTEGVLR